MTLVDALRLTVETFGGAILMLGAVWTVVTIEERLRVLISPQSAVPQTPSKAEG